MAKKKDEFESHLTDEELAALDAEIDEEPDTGELITDALIKRAAALASGGTMTKVAMQKALKLSQRRVNNIYKDERFKQLVQEISDDAVAAAKAKTRNDISRMQAKAMKALEDNLDKKSLEAVKIFLKAMGLDQEKEGAENNSFSIVLANSKPEPQTIQVIREGEE